MQSDETTPTFLAPVRAPFDLRLTVGALRRLPSSALYPLVDGEFRFLAPLPSGHRLLAVRAATPDAATAGLFCVAQDGNLSQADREEAQRQISRLLGAQRDLEPAWALLADEPELATLAQRLAGMKPPCFLSLWEAFCQIVPFQQVSLHAAVATLNRFVMAFGPRCEYGGQTYWGLPAPARVLTTATSELRACGLSEGKTRTLRALAERALAGELEASAFDGAPDEEVIAALTQIPGIGRWSAQVALLRGLGRLSICPAGDSGAIRSLREVFAHREDADAAASALLSRAGAWQGYVYFMLLGRRLLASATDI